MITQEVLEALKAGKRVQYFSTYLEGWLDVLPNEVVGIPAYPLMHSEWRVAPTIKVKKELIRFANVYSKGTRIGDLYRTEADAKLAKCARGQTVQVTISFEVVEEEEV